MATLRTIKHGPKPDLKAKGTVIKQLESARSADIQTSNGQMRRNRKIPPRVLEERLQCHPRMRAMRAANQHQQEREPQTFSQHLEIAKNTTESSLSLRTNEQ